ncbi:MAG: hypothetical protein ICV77_08260 [Cyanobacteria bacterium Co-bin8]|nr:hypothetical protein [Cyanobacteria bacterium Co-bin8]
MTVVIDPPGYYLWDFAGANGLQAARNLFGNRVSELAPFQSLESSFNAHACSVLRLCENNFRVALSRDHEFDLAIEEMNLNVWVRQCNPFQRPPQKRQATPASDRMATLVLSEKLAQACLHHLATTKPIYRLEDLPLHCAVPARLQQKAILVWHHPWLGHPRFELHTAQADVQSIAEAITAEAITVEIASHTLPDTRRGTTAATRSHHSAL